MTRDEKMDRIRTHAIGMSMVTVEYVTALKTIHTVSDRSLDIILAVGEAIHAAHQSVLKTYEPVVRWTNN